MSVVGVDLGTTNTVVGCVRGGKVHVLADERGHRLLPSVVSFHPNGEVLVGDAAKERRVIDAASTVYSHKRLIGRSWTSPEIAQARQRFAFELREGPGQGPLVHARGQDYTLPEVSGFVLKRARQIAERALGVGVERAVITVPAHFNELQRASTKVAGRIAGLEVLRILNEPTAAALAYGLGRSGTERVAVYDFGGGTFDCTLLDLNGNVFEVLATAGDSFLGGDDVDNLIADRMAETFLKLHRLDPRQDAQMYERLKASAEDVKIALSKAESHTVVLHGFAHGAKGKTLDFPFTLSRGELDAMLTPLVDRTFQVTQDALALARLAPTSFDKIILVGGSTRIPLVRKRVEAFFGSPPMDRVNPDEVVAIGAAIQAAALTEGLRRRSIPPPPTSASKQPAAPDADDPTLSDASRATTEVRPPVTSEPSIAGAKTTPLRGRQPTIAGVAPPDWAPGGRLDPEHTPVHPIPVPGSTTARMASAPPPPTPPTPRASSRNVAGANKTVPTAPNTAPMIRRSGANPPFGQTAPLVSPAAVASLGQTLPLPPSAPPSRPPPLPSAPPTRRDMPTLTTPLEVPVTQPARSSQPPALPVSAYASSPPPLVGNYHAPPGPSSRPPSGAYGSLPPQPFSLPSTPPLQTLSRPPVLVDVTPRALIVETAGGFTDVVVQRNAKIPCERTRRFSTGRDMQTSVRVRVAQGEDPVFAKNTYLGEVELTGLRAGPRGTVTLAVTFEVDANGTLRVRARDVETGIEARAQLQLVGIANESSVMMMMNRLAQTPVNPGPPRS